MNEELSGWNRNSDSVESGLQNQIQHSGEMLAEAERTNFELTELEKLNECKRYKALSGETEKIEELNVLKMDVTTMVPEG